MGQTLTNFFAFDPPPSNRYDPTFVTGWIRRDQAQPAEGAIPYKLYHATPPVRVSTQPNQQSRLTLFFSHGNAEDMLDTHPIITRLSNDLHVDVFTYEYPGYGLNHGIPSEETCIRDTIICWNYLTDQLGVDPGAVVVVGRSIGSGPAIHVAAQSIMKPCGLVLISPITSCIGVLFPHLADLPGDIFCNTNKIGCVGCDTVIMHGTRDTVVPIDRGGLALWNICKSNPISCQYHEFVGVGHNDLLNRCWKEVTDLLSVFLSTKSTMPP